MTSHLADHASQPITIVRGEGVYLYGDDGKRYLDFSAGWCVGNIGWGRAKLREAIEKEARRGTYIPPSLRFQEAEDFAAELIRIAPGNGLTRAVRCTSGSEAVEMAIKCARAATGRKTIVSVQGVYHGHTYGAAAVGSACCNKMEPCVSGVQKVAMPGLPGGISAEETIGQFAGILERQGGDVAAFLSEPVWTNAGVVIPPADFYPAIERLCRAHGVLLVMDEVATGFGRCGTLFGSELWGIQPDILCLGKALTGGYGTMGATLITEHVFSQSRGLPLYSTFGWNALDLTASQANVAVVLQERLWENARTTGAYLFDLLRAVAAALKMGEVRGQGLLLAMDVVDGDGIPSETRASSIQEACARNGLLVETAGSALFITPPLILTREQASKGAELLEGAIRSLS